MQNAKVPKLLKFKGESRLIINSPPLLPKLIPVKKLSKRFSNKFKLNPFNKNFHTELNRRRRITQDSKLTRLTKNDEDPGNRNLEQDSARDNLRLKDVNNVEVNTLLRCYQNFLNDKIEYLSTRLKYINNLEEVNKGEFVNIKDYKNFEDNCISDISDNFMFNSNSCPTHSPKMLPTAVDQNRQDNLHPQTVHVHMHQVCTCMHPYYPSYRPPIMTPYHVQPVPRPYNLQHYQYTQFNLSPYNFPIMHASAAAIAQQPPNVASSPHPCPTSILDFGPPPRDRRNFENAEIPAQDIASNVATDITKDSFLEDYNLPLSNLSDLLQSNQETVGAHSLTSTTENFTKFLERGCIIAEKIAIRNQHRPCFKNIQNLCNRTRSEILKPSNTVSNIHSQGIPWATKDFIYAFVRLINCWHMLKGYLDSKDGTLGNIDRELTPEFKNCYLAWEKNTKELAAHMIRIFTNLDNNVSNPNAVIHKSKGSSSQESLQKADLTQLKVVKDSNGKVHRNTLHIHATTAELVEAVVASESTETSPRDEDSDNESRVYMKPGSYNVPKKNNDSSNSSPSIEFFDTAQNVSAHYKKMAKKKHDPVPSTTDKMWQDAQSAVPFLMNKMIPSKVENANKNAEELEENALKYFTDLNILDQGSDIQEWLNNNNFFENQNGGDSGQDNVLLSSRSYVAPPKPVTVLQRSPLPKLMKLTDQNMGEHSNLCRPLKWSQQKNSNAVQTRTYRKRNDALEKNTPKSLQSYKKNVCSIWEYEKGGLTANAIVTLEDILKNIEKEEFAKRIYYNSTEKEDADELKNPTSLLTIRKKLTCRKYNYLKEFVHDLRNIISCAEIYYENRPDIVEQVSSFEETFEDALTAIFPNFDFSSITGEINEEVGPIALRKSKKSDDDGDH